MEENTLRERLFQIELKRKKLVQEFLLNIGLTPGQGQARILKYLSAGHPVTQKELADACSLDVTTMSRNLDKMEQAGFLKRSMNPECRRSYLIELTESGYQKAEQVKVGFQKLENILGEGMEAGEKQMLNALLQKINENLDRNRLL